MAYTGVVETNFPMTGLVYKLPWQCTHFIPTLCMELCLSIFVPFNKKLCVNLPENIGLWQHCLYFNSCIKSYTVLTLFVATFEIWFVAHAGHFFEILKNRYRTNYKNSILFTDVTKWILFLNDFFVALPIQIKKIYNILKQNMFFDNKFFHTSVSTNVRNYIPV